MKYKASRDLLEFSLEYRTVSPSKLAEVVLNRRNVKITPESVTMWFKRHSEIFAALSQEIAEGLPNAKQAVDASMFEKVSFQEIPSVKEWILYMRTRRRKGKPLLPHYINNQANLLRQMCRTYEKHPDRLSYHDAQTIFLEEENKGKDTCQYRRAIKDFLKSKGAGEWEKIGVGKPRGFQKFQNLYVEKPTVLAMLDWIQTRNFPIGILDRIMYRNGLRLSAALFAKIEDYKPNGDFDYITVLEKFREVKTFTVMRNLGDQIKQVIGARETGRIFEAINPNNNEVNELNREALKVFVPKLEPEIKMPSHFFRHMCAQHLLRASDWNSKVVAAIMQCTEQSLNESYGGAPKGEVQKWCLKYLPSLEASEEEICVEAVNRSSKLHKREKDEI